MPQPILSTDSETEARIKTNYNTLIVNNYVDRQDDQLAHIEDTELFPVIRDGVRVYVTWNQIKPEEHRAAFVNVFLPCSWEEVY